MAFDSLAEKLQNVFKSLRSKGLLTEADVKAALKEVKMALLEADVNFKVVKQFVGTVQERAVGQDVMTGLNPGQRLGEGELRLLAGEHILAGDDACGDLIVAEEDNIGDGELVGVVHLRLELLLLGIELGAHTRAAQLRRQRDGR